MPLLWIDIVIKSIFIEFIFEGEDTERYNYIYLDITNLNLLMGLEVFAKNSDELEIRLSKENFPYLKLSGLISTGKRFGDLETKIPVIGDNDDRHNYKKTITCCIASSKIFVELFYEIIVIAFRGFACQC